MTVETIVNNHRFKSCPFCNSASIRKTGDLNYREMMQYSTHIISLSLIPEMWKCINCRSLFTQNTIPPLVAERLYETGEGNKRWSPENFESDKTERMRYFLKKYLQQNLTLLDVGCNTGEFLDFARVEGVQTAGLEFCLNSLEIIRNKGHKSFRTGSEIKEKFDIITAFDVLEHVYDPNGFLEFAGSILRSNGKLIILTGNPASISAQMSGSNWWYVNYPEHVIFPSPLFFRNAKGFKFEASIKVFASIAHEEKGLFFLIKNSIKILIGKKYSGRPAIFPDHQLIVLQKI